MSDNDYFFESVPDGISNAISELDDNIDCCNQDSFELLVLTFGSDVCGDDLKKADAESYEKFAQNMRRYFELDYSPKRTDAKLIIEKALAQWGG